GPLGAAYAPFVPGGAGGLQQDMKLKVPRDRLDDRRLLREQFDGLKRHLDTSGTADALDRFEAQALDGLLRGAAYACDLSRGTPRSRPATTRRRWSPPSRSTRSGTTTRCTPTTPAPWAACCCWRGVWSRPAAASSRSTPTSSR